MKSNLLTSNELNKALQLDPNRELIMIGSIGESAITEDDTLTLLKQERQALGRDGDFIGKSTTCMYVSDQHVIKLQQQVSFTDGRIASKWVEHRLKKELAVGLYHPSRSWFLFQDKGKWFAGNITIRLQRFHQLFENKTLQPHIAMPWIIQVCDKYLRHAAQGQDRLDEGLSNFGLDGNQLYYLDDDIFGWDHFHAFSALIAGWFRRYSTRWFNSESTAQLGTEIRRMLDTYFEKGSGIDAPQVIAEQIKGMFFPAGTIQEAADAFRMALIHRVEPAQRGLTANHWDAESFAAFFDDDEPILLLADIHANLPALEAVLAHTRTWGIKRVCVLGDVVGYGPHPAQCIDVLQSINAFTIRGNHDHAIGSQEKVRTMSASSTWAASWSQQHLNNQHRQYLANLPTRILNRPWIAVHGSPVDHTFFNAYVYDRTAEKNLQWLLDEGFRFCLHGHCHIQAVYSMEHGGVPQKITEQNNIDLANTGRTHLICPGSVGQPRGGDPRAAFAVLYPAQQRLENHRIDYPLQQTIQDMIINGFPEQLIQRLRNGV